MRPLALVLAALALAPTVALAQAEPTDVVPETIEGRPAVYKAVTELEMGGADVNATVVRPDGSIVQELKRPAFGSLAILRANFNPELEQSASQIR